MISAALAEYTACGPRPQTAKRPGHHAQPGNDGGGSHLRAPGHRQASSLTRPGNTGRRPGTVGCRAHRWVRGLIRFPGDSVQPFVRTLEHFTILPSPGSQDGEPSGEEPPGVWGSLGGHLPWETALREPSRLVQTGSRPTSHRGGHWFDPVSPTRSGPYDDVSKDHCGSHSGSGPHDSSLAGLHDGIVTNVSYTVAHAIEDWLADGLAGRAAKTASTQREVLEPLIDIIGAARDPLARRTAHKGRREKPAPSLCRQPAG